MRTQAKNGTLRDFKWIKSIAIVLAFFILFGCGGDSDDNTAPTATDTVTINPVNDPPVANAGDEQTVDELTVVALSGTGTDIEDGGNIAYAWTQTGGPSVTLTGTDTATPSFIAPAVSASTDLIFTLTVTDSKGATDTDDVTVTVNNVTSLQGCVATPPDTVNLSAEGGLDWSHWGFDGFNLNCKDGGTGEIGDYDDIGTIDASLSNGSPTAFSWTDGTPGIEVTNTTTRLMFQYPGEIDVDEGVRLTIPANTSEKTLKVYVGAYSAQGRFRATLSDGSTPAYEVILDNPLSQQAIWVVTLTFGAAADGETLTLEYTLSEDTGVDVGGHINLAAATLTLAEARVATPTINPPGGTYTDSVTVVLETATYGATIRYTLDSTDPNVNSYLYDAPFEFDESMTVKAMAFLTGFNDSAIASADFTVNAGTGGNLSAFVATPPDTVNLSAEGGLDWSHWGFDGFNLNCKDGGTGEIGDYDDIGTIDASLSNGSPTAFSWTDGTPGIEVTNTTTRLMFQYPGEIDVDEGVRLTIPANTSEKTLKVYVGAYSAQGRFRATLSDGSTPAYEVILDNPLSQQAIWVVTLTFGAAADGETLTLEYTLSEDTGVDVGGHINLTAATLD